MYCVVVCDCIVWLCVTVLCGCVWLYCVVVCDCIVWLCVTVLYGCVWLYCVVVCDCIVWLCVTVLWGCVWLYCVVVCDCILWLCVTVFCGCVWLYCGVVCDFIVWLCVTVLCGYVWLYYHKIYIVGVWLVLCRVATGRNFLRKKNRYFSTKLDRFITKTTRIFIFIYGLFTEPVIGWRYELQRQDLWWLICIPEGVKPPKVYTSMGITGPEPKYELDCTQKWRRRAE